MSEFKRQACMHALKEEGIKEDWRLIYFYEDTENPNIWHLKQGIDYLGYVERGKPTRDIEKLFCELIDWMSYYGYKGVILNTNKTAHTPNDFYFKGIYSLSNFLGLLAKRNSVIKVRDVNTNISLPEGNSIEKFVLHYVQDLYELFNGLNRINALCRDLTIKSPHYEFSFYQNVNGILSIFCQDKAVSTCSTCMKIVEIKCI